MDLGRPAVFKIIAVQRECFNFLILHDGMCQLAANVSRSERLLPSVGYQ